MPDLGILVQPVPSSFLIAQARRLEGGQKQVGRFFVDKPDALSMLSAIEDEVHVEVRKLYPEAELPRFETERLAEDSLRMTYRSPRPLSDICHGLVEGCVDHFGRPADIRRQQVSDAHEHVCAFTINLRG